MASLKEIKIELKRLRVKCARSKAGLYSWKTQRHESKELAQWRGYSAKIFDQFNADLEKLIKKLEEITG